MPIFPSFLAAEDDAAADVLGQGFLKNTAVDDFHGTGAHSHAPPVGVMALGSASNAKQAFFSYGRHYTIYKTLSDTPKLHKLGPPRRPATGTGRDSWTKLQLVDRVGIFRYPPARRDGKLTLFGPPEGPARPIPRPRRIRNSVPYPLPLQAIRRTHPRQIGGGLSAWACWPHSPCRSG